MKQLYPAMLDLHNRPCLVIGGGHVAERKIVSLIEANAKVTVIAPEVTKHILHLYEADNLELKKREYQQGDAVDFLFIVIATNDGELNQSIYQDIHPSFQFVNVVDAPEICTFIVPAVVNRGKLQIAISTNGASPGLAKKVKGKLEKQFGEEYVLYTDFLAEAREWVLSQHLSQPFRRMLLATLLDDSMITRVNQGEKNLIFEELTLMIARYQQGEERNKG